MFINQEEKIHRLLGFYNSDLIRDNIQHDVIGEFDRKLTENMTVVNITQIKLMFEMAMDITSVQPMTGWTGKIFTMGQTDLKS